ncbi:MAG: hypothetical protein KAI18_03295 [Candidatus Aenigmarchaeota archaeon]|nr:hypothetical protein [Candidatus Aenigmarchaeota archaeon]
MSIFKQSKKKGLSPLIATVLLVVFTIGIATIIISWMNTYTKDATLDANADTQSMLDCTNTNIDIDKVYILSENSVKVIARNTGHKPLILKEAFIWDVNGTRCNLNITEETLAESESIELVNDSCLTTFTADCPEFDMATVSTTCSMTSKVEEISNIVCNVY